jgi:thioredoxin reductase (NADPH)
MNNKKTKKVVKFSASWCGPCRVYAPTFKKVSEMEDFKDITFETIDIEDSDEMTPTIEKLGIKSVPTTILFDENDEPIYKVLGNVPMKDLVDLINSTLKDKEEED